MSANKKTATLKDGTEVEFFALAGPEQEILRSSTASGDLMQETIFDILGSCVTRIGDNFSPTKGTFGKLLPCMVSDLLYHLYIFTYEEDTFRFTLPYEKKDNTIGFASFKKELFYFLEVDEAGEQVRVDGFKITEPRYVVPTFLDTTAKTERIIVTLPKSGRKIGFYPASYGKMLAVAKDAIKNRSNKDVKVSYGKMAASSRGLVEYIKPNVEEVEISFDPTSRDVHALDLRFLENTFKEYEGSASTELTVTYPDDKEGSRIELIDITQLPDFFFQSDM